MTTSPARRADQLPADYPEFLAELKTRIAAARTRAALAVNSELIKLYWEIGRDILDRERREGWGAKVIDRLATDLRRGFPEMKGLSRSNLHYMRQLAAAWPDDEAVPQPVGQLPWGHIRCLLDKLDDPSPRLWYAAKAVENSWSRKILEAQIATDLRGRQGSALTSFEHSLLPTDSELVRDAIKDPYNFEFLGLSETAKERDLELALLNDVQSFLVEMGRGFALVGRALPGSQQDRDRVGPARRRRPGRRCALHNGRDDAHGHPACRAPRRAPGSPRARQRTLEYRRGRERNLRRERQRSQAPGRIAPEIRYLSHRLWDKCD